MFDTCDTSVICIDVQEKLVKMLNNADLIAQNCAKLMKTASILDVDTIVTEQYPKGLGETIDLIKSIKKFATIEKTTFSILKDSKFYDIFKKLNNKNIIIFGIESHICILQSVIDLIECGYNVFVVEDCCASRNKENHKIAMELMKQKGANIITLEIALFNFLKSSKHPNFKEIQQLIK